MPPRYYIPIVPARFLPWTTGNQAGTPMFFNRPNSDGAGYESVYEQYQVADVPLTGLPLFSGDMGDVYLDECDHEYFLAFFNGHRGRFQPFQFRYWADYECTHIAKPNCIDPTMTEQGVTYPFRGDGVKTEFKLLKAYANNASDINYRRIYLPDSTTLKVYKNSAEVLRGSAPDEYQLGSNGTITFNTAPANQALITHSCEFDLIVRFDSDQFAIEVISANDEITRFKLGSLPIKEIVPLLD
jgi:uncharacterized protein (TIGR02217 family)